MQLRLHNTLTRTKEVFEPIDPNRVRLYVCGPTVYQRIHVGNARAFVVFDVLYRLLRHLYGADNVVYVRNITDIDDKIIDQAREERRGHPHADRAHHGRLPRRPRRPGLPAADPRAARHRARAGHDRADRDADRARPRLRRRGPRPVQRPLDAGLRPPVRPQPRRADRRRPGRRRPLQARPRRLRPVEALDRRPARLGQPLGPRPPRLAHRVLGHERGVPRPRSRSTSTPAAST